MYLDTLQPDSLARIRELEVGQGVQPQAATTPILEPPKFITHISNITQLVEGQSAHFEARLTPVNDPNLTVSSSSSCFIFTPLLLFCWNYCIWHITVTVCRWISWWSSKKLYFPRREITGKIKIYSTIQHTLAICGSFILGSHSQMLKLLGSSGNNRVRRTSDRGKV